MIFARPHFFGTVSIALAYMAGPLPNTVDNPPWSLWFTPGSYNATPMLWGPGSLNLDHGSTAFLFGPDQGREPGGTYVASFLQTGTEGFPALALDGLTTGYAFGDAGFSGPYALTPSNVDLHRGLQQPQTGSKYMTALP